MIKPTIVTTYIYRKNAFKYGLDASFMPYELFLAIKGDRLDFSKAIQEYLIQKLGLSYCKTLSIFLEPLPRMRG